MQNHEMKKNYWQQKEGMESTNKLLPGLLANGERNNVYSGAVIAIAASRTV